MEEFKRDRTSVEKVQKVAHETQTMGVFKNTEREAFAKKFADYALAKIQELARDKKLPYSILPEHEEKSYKLFRKVVKLHVGAFSKANNDNLTDTIFDLSNDSPETVENRKSYIAELMSIAFENVNAFGGKDEKAFKLATYRDAKWISGWMEGTLIEQHLVASELYTQEQITAFLNGYSSSYRIHTAVSNIKNPDMALDTIAVNYLTKLSDEGIRTYFERKLTEGEIDTFLEAFPTGYRMKIAVHNSKNPEVALDTIAENYLTKLSDEGIRKYFKGKLSDDEIDTFLKGYPSSYRMHTAVNSIKNLEPTLENIATGKLEIPGGRGRKFSFVLESVPQ